MRSHEDLTMPGHVLCTHPLTVALSEVIGEDITVPTQIRTATNQVKVSL